jgi:hypothetical protein
MVYFNHSINICCDLLYRTLWRPEEKCELSFTLSYKIWAPLHRFSRNLCIIINVLCIFIVIYVLLLLCLCILIVRLCMAILTEGFPCFFLICKANARVKPAKTRKRPALFVIFVLFYVLFALCRSVHCLCVYVYCTTTTGWLPNCC